MTRKFVKKKEEKEFCKILIIFLLGVIVYGIIASFFTATVHVNVDEELYVALAKSFHYTGDFKVNGSLADYNCVLYSVIISFAYFFYSPEHILFFMRLIGVICMCSSIFPIWLLADKVLSNAKEVLIISIISMFLPYMFDCVYLMQEVLSYPLFLWTVYVMYLSYENQANRKGYFFFAVSAVLSVLCFFTKTYLFFISVVFNICFFWNVWKQKEHKEIIKKLCIYDFTFLGISGLFYFLIQASNGFAQGNNHYAGQFLWLFPITKWTIFSGIVCIIVYAALLIVNMGIIPVFSLLLNCNKLNSINKWLVNFVLNSCGFLVIEIVLLIVLTEEGVPTIPHKFLFRYFQVLAPLVLILFWKLKKETEFLYQKKFWIMAGFCLAVCFAYFYYMKGSTRQSIADGYFYLLLENITKNILPYADTIAVLALSALLGFLIIYMNKKKIADMNIFIKIVMIGIAVMWVINFIQLPLYTNKITDGEGTQDDSIVIANYLNVNDCSFIYYVVSSEAEADSYTRNFYGYMKQPHQVINVSELEKTLEENSSGNIACLTSEGLDLTEFNLVRQELNTKKIMVYMVQ